MNLWESGSVDSHHGEYVESTLVNGHPSWISGTHAIWYTDDAQVSFSSCQRNLIKTFQIEGMIALITKLICFFHETC